jgi:hypothetical protein
MASKWIQAAVKQAVGGESRLTGNEPFLFKDRPALADFMTETEHEDGSQREPSVLMVCISTDGIRVGLKDDDAGGWLWRVEDTLVKALNAIEKALQSGNVKWSKPGGQRGKRK